MARQEQARQIDAFAENIIGHARGNPGDDLGLGPGGAKPFRRLPARDLDQVRLAKIVEQGAIVALAHPTGKTGLAQFVQRIVRLGDFAVAKVAETEDRLLAIAHADIEALRLQAQAPEIGDKGALRFAQGLTVDLADKGQHLGKMVMVIGGRQDDLRTRHGFVLYSFAAFVTSRLTKMRTLVP